MRASLLFVLLVLLASLGLAQNEATYRLQPEDLIRIQVYREENLIADIPIGRDGNIVAPFVGVVRAAGKTVTELAAELEQLYEARLRIRDPRVSVSILRFRSIRASIVGEVRRADTYDLRQGDTVLTLLARAGGINPDRADLRRAVLRRASTNELIPIDLYTMLNLADTSQNYVIEDGDEFTVPERERPFVSIIGAVPSPGPLPFRENMTVADALAFARWEVRHRSMLSRTRIIRELPGNPGEYMHIEVNMVKWQEGDNSQNILLQPGDLVLVPDTRTPDFDRMAAIAGSLFYLDRILNGDFFGFRIFGR